MYRALFVVVAFAALIGCKKKSEDAGPGGDAAPADTTAYTIKIAKRDKGTKWQITTEKTKSFTTSTKKEGTGTETEKEKQDYIETILASENDKPTKLTRAYRYAQKAGKSGTYQDLPYSGKSVLIEKKGDLYTFTVDGRQLAPREAEALLEEFKPTKRKNGAESDEEKWLPKAAVRIGEKWDIPTDEGDRAMEKATGRLTKAYRNKSGRQCGVITFEGEMTVPIEANKPSKVSLVFTRDGPIDGTSGETKITSKITAKWKMTDPEHGEITASMELTETKTASAVE